MQDDQSMQAVRIAEFGGPEVLRYETLPVPEPGEDELLVRVAAAGVNPVDSKIRAGKYPAVQKDKLPYVLGRDVAGTVVKRGASVSRFAEGDIIFAMPAIERGGYAQYVLVREQEAAPKPKSLDLVAAGGVPLAALTAWQGLFVHGNLRKGQRVLIHGGSGGVGHFAIQFAKWKGAHVATTVSAENTGFVRRLGADEAIDYDRESFEDEVAEVDLVFDLVGGETQERSWIVLKTGGVLVSTLTQPSNERAAARGLRYTATESGEDLAKIGELIDSGFVKPVITKTYPLAEAAAAQQFLQGQHPRGKIVLVVS
jgi:NADPH:quinone reductase-like Zn-dependent oxidoreductase